MFALSATKLCSKIHIHFLRRQVLKKETIVFQIYRRNGALAAVQKCRNADAPFLIKIKKLLKGWKLL